MSFFRTPIDPEVQKELFRRIDGVNKDYSGNILQPVENPFENEYFKSCWARVITIDNDSKNGKPYFLNSQLGDDGKTPITEPLNIRGGDYSRGRAGITSISSNFKEFFLKQSTISFLCPDPKEFEVIQQKFLKHGRYCLVEFGWSTRKNIKLKEINTSNLVKFANNLNSRTKGSRGNYAAICGVITNFNFNQKQDGSYEGTFEVSSMGRNVLGQKIKTDGKLENLVSFVDERVKAIEEGSLTTKTELEKLSLFRETFVNFHATIKGLPDVIQDYIENSQYTGKRESSTLELPSNEDGSDLPTEQPVITSKNGAAYIPVSKDLKFKTPGEEKPFAYCTWGWFEDYVLNSFFAFTSKNDSQFKSRFFSTNEIYSEDGKEVIGNQSTQCRTNPNLFSLGLQSVILPGKFKQFSPDSQREESGTNRDAFGLGTKVGRRMRERLTSEHENREKALSKVISHFSQHFEPFEIDYDVYIGDTRGGVSNYTVNPEGLLIQKENFYPIQVGVLGAGKPNVGQIRNMVFEANYLMESFDNETNIDQALMRFWQKVSNDYGGFWRFGVVQDEDVDGKIKIEDLNIGLEDDSDVQNKLSTPEDPTKIFEFPLYEKDSIIQDFSLETAYDSEMATMAVFGSNADVRATRGDMGQGYTELAIRSLSLIQNKDNIQTTGEEFYDDFLNKLEIPTNSNPQQQGTSSTGAKTNLIKQITSGGIKFTEIEGVRKNKDKIVEDIQNQNTLSHKEEDLRKGYFWFNTADDITQIYAARTGQMLQEFKRTMLYKINKSSDPDDASNYNVVLPAVPLQLNLTIQGIGGIKIGDLFYIRYLPEMYKKYCHWMIVGVDHTIETTGWTTKLDARMIVDIPKLVKDYKGELSKTEFKPFQVPPGKQLSDILRKIQTNIEFINKVKANTQIQREAQDVDIDTKEGAQELLKKTRNRWFRNLIYGEGEGSPSFDADLVSYEELIKKFGSEADIAVNLTEEERTKLGYQN
tara:strand:- start:769 stop:3711 length:2943 start_codon:yes stop_codon:yes gene_type:complete